MRVLTFVLVLVAACNGGGLSLDTDGGALDGARADGGGECAVHRTIAGCQAAGCVASFCTGCDGKPLEPIACLEKDGPQPGACQQPACPPACEGLTEGQCDADPACHPVYRNGLTCACAALGCCMMFDRCAAGARPRCGGSALCPLPPPRCEGDYVLSYTQDGTCFEGCVRRSACGT